MIDARGQETLTGSAQSEIFQILRDDQPRTRSELAALTGLARSTVAARVDALLAAKLISPVSDAASTGGRPSRQFAFDGTAHGVLGVDIGATHIHLALTDLHGTMLVDKQVSISVAEGPEKVLTWVVEEGRRLLRSAQQARHVARASAWACPARWNTRRAARSTPRSCRDGIASTCRAP